MKKSLLSLLILTLLTLCCCTKSLPVPRTIENPVVDGQNVSTLTVTGVDLTDSSTVLRIHCDFRPGYWMKISSESQIEANGVKYQILGGEGITPDSLLWMPESGQADFSLIFPAIPGSTESIDFYEGEGEDQWHIWGIDLTGESNPSWLAELPAKVRKGHNLNAPMQQALLDTGVTRVDFQVLGYKTGMPSKISLQARHLGDYESKEYLVKLDSLGRGTLETWMAGTTRLFLIDEQAGRSYGFVWLAPGETAKVYVAPVQANSRIKSEYPRVYLEGYYSPMVEAFVEDAFTSSPDFAFTDTEEEYFAKMKNHYELLADSIAASDYPRMTKEYLKALHDVYTMRYAEAPVEELQYRFYTAKGWSRDVVFSPDSLKFTKLTPEHLREVGSWFDAGSADLLIVNSGQYFGPKWVDWTEYGATTNLQAEFVAYDEVISSPQSITAEKIDSLRSFSSPFFAAAAEGYKSAYDKVMLSAENAVQPTPDVEPDKVLDEILKPHAGKVVMVDLWNTWCGPCRHALAANEPEKDGDLSSDDIVWIYIANQTSPIEKYLQMIPDIRGLHYRLTPEQWSSICSRFGVDGIPYYVLVGRNGKPEGRPDLRDHDLFKKEILNKLNGK